MNHLVFVYGTLRSGESNNAFMRGTLVGTATVEGVLYDGGSFPGLRVEPGFHVRGELWEVDDDSLARLDRLEGVSIGLFERLRVPATREDNGEVVDTWAYQIGERYLASRTRRAKPGVVDWVTDRR